MKYSRVVFITGASSGIGFSIGQYLSLQNFQVVGTSRNPEKYINHPFPLITMDVLDENSIKTAIKQVIIKYNTIDVVINNAGMGMFSPLESLTSGPLDMVMNTNFKGPILVIQHALPYMHKQHSGLIINIASIAGNNGLPFRSIYSASKSALMRVSESLRLELRHTPIQCTVVSPGSIKTSIASNRYYAGVSKDSIYYKQYELGRLDMDNHVNKGLLPIVVAKKIEKIINKKNIKPHYVVGPLLEALSSIIKFILPQRMYENLIASFYNLN
jgi:NADP-dependent 3-hydroxy acid dehydrogenase YdfG